MLVQVFLKYRSKGGAEEVKKCKYCKSDIDEKAKICPNCKKRQGSSLGRIILGVAIGIIGIVIIANSGSGTNSSISEEKFDYEVTNQYADEYGMSYYIEGTVKNKKNKDYSYVQIEFVCYDSAGNNLGTAIDNTNNLLGNQNWKFKAMAMFTDVTNIDHCDYHEITGW